MTQPEPPGTGTTGIVTERRTGRCVVTCLVVTPADAEAADEAAFSA